MIFLVQFCDILHSLQGEVLEPLERCDLVDSCCFIILYVLLYLLLLSFMILCPLIFTMIAGIICLRHMPIHHIVLDMIGHWTIPERYKT